MHVYGWLKVAFGICCLGKTCGGIFCLGKTCCLGKTWVAVCFDWRHDFPNTMLPAKSEKLGFKKKKGILPDITAIFLFWCHQKSRVNYYFEILLCFIKLCKSYDK